ncbi:SURF1 family protein [Kineococcus sp. SYSU DK005]|uniref:SURF1 family protein n=1 Tax=Kineococcus sp. SYSU DK005 TaxID=3383126 RepID=UPI003D7D9E5D
MAQPSRTGAERGVETGAPPGARTGAAAGPAARPRRSSALLLTAVAWLAVAVCVVLGLWQWSRGNVVVSDPPAGRPVVDVAQVVSAAAPAASAGAVLSRDEVGRRVRVGGTFDPAVQLLVAGRPLDGREGAWALGVVRLPDGTGVPVVRGWVPEGGQAPPAPAGPVDLLGVVQPPETSDIAPSSAALPPGWTYVVSAADLVNRVDYPVANAYVTAAEPVAAAEPAAAGTGAAPLSAVPPVDPGEATRHLDWRNLAYAAQWWVFALFALVLWRRALRDLRADAARDAAAGGAPAGPAPDPAPGPGADPAGGAPAGGGQDRAPHPADGPGGRDVSSTR